MFKYRPPKENHIGYDKDEDGYWEDNPASNALAYLSDRFFPRWCQTQEHWTMRLMDYFWASCACCLFFRGLVMGYVIGAFVGALVTAAVALLFF